MSSACPTSSDGIAISVATGPSPCIPTDGQPCVSAVSCPVPPPTGTDGGWPPARICVGPSCQRNSPSGAVVADPLPSGSSECESGLPGCPPVTLIGSADAGACDAGDCGAKRESAAMCTPGQRQCNDDTPQLCDSQGAWSDLDACAGETPVCLQSTGACVACRPGSEVCLARIVQLCTAEGSYQSTGVCASAQLDCGGCDVGGPCKSDQDCNGTICLAGACATCRPGDTTCVGTTPRTCGPDGNWVNGAPCGGDYPVCVPETASCACQEGRYDCTAMGTERVCAQAELIESACALGAACQDGHCRAQEWTRQFGSDAYDAAAALAVDAANDVYVAGASGGALPDQVKVGSAAAFLRKYDAAGHELWTLQTGAGDTTAALAVGLDGQGNVYLAGGTTGALSGSSNAGGMDAFLSKYDSNGNLLWTVQFGSAADDEVYGIVVDGNDDVLLAGTTAGALPGQVNLGGNDAFVRKYDARGNELWTRQFGTPQTEFAKAVAVDGNANVLVAGETLGALPGQINAGSNDAFVVAYDARGAQLWIRQFGSSDVDDANAVGTDAAGNVYVAGSGLGSVPGQPVPGNLASFIRKYDASGTEVWTQRFVAGLATEVMAESVDAQGNVLVAGNVTLSFPSGTDPGTTDAFLGAWDSGGNELWTAQFGSPSHDFALAARFDAGGNALVAGTTGGTLPGQSSAGGPQDAFVSRLVR